jgi:NADPH:quinone reductase-like Zn-dependent oxidoreductase
MAKAIEQRVWPLIAAGKVKPVVDSTFDLAQASEAHRRIDDPDHVGKIVLITKEIDS